jgi:hypothetical protein
LKRFLGIQIYYVVYLSFHEIYWDYWLLVSAFEIFIRLLRNILEILYFVLLWENNLLCFWRRELRLSLWPLMLPKVWLNLIKSLNLNLTFIKLFEIFKILYFKNQTYPLNYTLLSACIKYFLLIEIKRRNFGRSCRWSFSNTYFYLGNRLIFFENRIILDLRTLSWYILKWQFAWLIQWRSGRPVAK